MKNIYTLLSFFVILSCLGGLSSFQTNTNPVPTEKLLRFIERTDPGGQTRTIIQEDYAGDLQNLPSGTVKKVDVRFNAKTGEILERKLLVLPVE